jgi:CO/xanthine dehydrogenase FAD-binding subunit
LQRNEILSAVHIPAGVMDAASAFAKLGARRYLVISIVMAAVVLPRDAQGCIRDARVAVGAASAVACRLPGLERALAGLPAGKRPSALIEIEHLAPLSPIDDVRATARYRRDAARAVIAEALDRAAGLAVDV